ncbi:hypothetical protein IQ270_25790 [Microcoleus sp. LEGE 07076]|uniref:hypothetical protein n=1 Tax=Microcoleus sp. LEGE 07076 TaxID=915322 RepID=UPI0018829889|nr:hypothetical protein [Microcoleus sp. LEGE 07076]MBE9187959.1 hypothetical protein [Microcoleus sp. LEGE 07076]
MNLISTAIDRISSLFKGFQIKSFLSVVLVGFLLLTTNVDAGSSNKAYGTQFGANADLNNPERPQTTREWRQEARETSDSPVERIQKIGQEAGAAVKEFGEMYQDTANRSIRELKDNTSDAS